MNSMGKKKLIKKTKNNKISNQKKTLTPELKIIVEKHLEYLKNKRYKLKKAKFSQDLRNFDFSNLDLREAIFENCNLKNTDFHNTNLSESEFINCEINNTNFREIIGKGIIFIMDDENNIISNSNFISATLESAELDECNFKNVSFKGANLISAYFTDSSLDMISFENSILTDVNFEDAKFTDKISVTNNTKLDYAKFTNSNINISLLEKVDLKNTLGLNNHFEIESEQIRKENIFLREKYNYTINELNKIKHKNIDITESNKILKNKKTESLINGFRELEKKLEIEEDIWYKRTEKLVIGLSIYVFSLFILSLFQNFGIESYVEKVIFGFIIFSATYFSVYQFNKIKNLRLENSNKIAIASGYQGFLYIHKDDDLKEVINNITDVLFTKIKHVKEKSLPIDEIIKIIKSINVSKYSEKDLVEIIDKKNNDKNN